MDAAILTISNFFLNAGNENEKTKVLLEKIAEEMKRSETIRLDYKSKLESISHKNVKLFFF